MAVPANDQGYWQKILNSCGPAKSSFALSGQDLELDPELLKFIRHVVLERMVPDIFSSVRILENGYSITLAMERRESWVARVKTAKRRSRPFDPR